MPQKTEVLNYSTANWMIIVQPLVYPNFHTISHGLHKQLSCGYPILKLANKFKADFSAWTEKNSSHLFLDLKFI